MRRPRPPRTFLVIVGIVALVAMHGASILAHRAVGHAAKSTPTSATSVQAPEAEHHPHHEHSDGGHNYPHDTAAMCALIVLAILVSTGRTVLSSLVKSSHGWRPMSPAWSPDPPIPRIRLVSHDL